MAHKTAASRTAILVLGLLLFAAACGGSATPTPTQPPWTQPGAQATPQTWNQTDITRQGLNDYSEYVRFDPAIAAVLNERASLGGDWLNEYWELLWDGAITICTEVAAGRQTFSSMGDLFVSGDVAGARRMVAGSRRYICPELD